MTELKLTVPEVGEKNTVADPRTQQALEAIRSFINTQQLNSGNFQEHGIEKASLATTILTELAERAGLTSQKSIIPAEESRTSKSFGPLGAPDEVTVTIPANGLIAIVFEALVKSSESGTTGRAVLTLNGNQLAAGVKSSAVTQAATVGSSGANELNILSSCANGLTCSKPGFAFTETLSTTGSVIGPGTESGCCYVFAAAGTYKIQVQYAQTGSGTITAKERKLWAWIVA